MNLNKSYSSVKLDSPLNAPFSISLILLRPISLKYQKACIKALNIQLLILVHCILRVSLDLNNEIMTIV